MGIQKKVVIAILATGFVALSIGLFLTYYQARNILTEAIGRDFAEIAKKSAERFDAAVKEEIDTFRRLSEETPFIKAVKENDRETLEVYLTHYLKHAEEKEEHIDLFVVNEEGVVIADSKLREGGKGEQTQEAWWNVVAGEKRRSVYASDIYLDDITGKKAFDMGIPVIDPDTGRVIGGIRNMMNVDNFFRFIKEMSFGETGHGMVVDSEGTPLICSILPLVEHSMNEPLIDLITTKGVGWAVAADDAHGGRNSIIGFSPVKYLDSLGPESLGGNKWYTFIRQNPEETFTPINRLLLKVLLFESIIVLFICAFGVYIVRRLLLSPINLLHTGVEVISKGNFDHKISIQTGDELESLASGFNKMGEALKGFYYNLEEKIRERTAALKASETKYRALMEQAYDSIFLVDPDSGQIMEVNLQAEMLTGLSREELLNLKYWDLYPKNMTNQAVEQFSKGVKRGFCTLHEVTIKGKNGSTAWVDISARLVGYNSIKVYHVVMRDITDRKKEEERLSLASEQLARSTVVMLEQDTRLAALRQEIISLSRQINMPEILVALSKILAEMSGITRIALFEQVGEVLRCRWVHGAENKRLQQVNITTEEDDPLNDVVRDLKVVRKGELDKGSQIDRYFGDWIAFPLRGKDRVIGVFVAGPAGSESNQNILQFCADIAAMVMEKEGLIKRIKT